jgi:hypothetical protein
MPESYAETETHIGQALHKLHDCEKPNIAAMACKFQVPMTNCALDKTDVKRHRTGQSQLNNKDLKICPDKSEKLNYMFRGYFLLLFMNEHSVP